MQHVGNVISLYISDKESSQILSKTQFSVNTEGILGDKHYGKETERSILITSIDSYAIIEKEGIHIPYGSLGENMLINYNPYHMSHGSRLQVGDAILEITQNCTLCKHLAVHDKRIPKLLRKDRGIFAKIIQPGNIHKNDLIYLI